MEFGTSPRKEKSQPLNPDTWVNSRSKKEELKRFTVDIPKSLHTRMKTACASKGVNMRDEVLKVLEKHFSANE